MNNSSTLPQDIDPAELIKDGKATDKLIQLIADQIMERLRLDMAVEQERKRHRWNQK
ncbi:MAG: hypothetical protein KC421_08505 [Anaerolineales bacterium]|nr:hypothetical protein [Anaerolineales bacterium]